VRAHSHRYFVDDLCEVYFNKNFEVSDRLRERHTLKGHVVSVVKLKGLDIDTIQQFYTI